MRWRFIFHPLNLLFLKRQIPGNFNPTQICLLPIFGFALFFPSHSFTMDWKEVQGDGFLFRFRASDRSLVDMLLPDLIIARTEIAQKLGGVFETAMTVYLVSSEADFLDLTGGKIPHWGVGVAFPKTKVVILKKLPGKGMDLLKVGRHEISHILLHNAVSGLIPVWFNEGVSMWSAQEWKLNESTEVFYAVLSGGLMPLKEIENILSFSTPRAQLAYSQSFLAVIFLIQAGGPDAVGKIVADVASGIPFDLALFRLTGLTANEFEKRFDCFIQDRYSLMAFLVLPEVLWIFLVCLFIVSYLCVRIRNRSVIEHWDSETPTDGLSLQFRLEDKQEESL